MDTMRTTSLLLVTALLLLGPGRARAQQTTFDFETPGPDQQGAYAPDADAEVTAGVARLLATSNPAWHSPNWGFRIGVRVENAGTQTLTDYPVRIDFAGAPDTVFDEARRGGADLLPVLVSTGAVLNQKWAESLDFITRTGSLWVKLPTLPPGTTELLVYFGNPAWTDGGDAETFFSEASGWVTQCVVSPVAAQLDLVVESFVDGNTISLEGGSASVTLDTRDSGTFVAADLSAGTYLRGTGAFYGAFDGDDVDALVPMTFAATRFVSPAYRYEERFDVVSPFGDALVSIYDNGTLVTSATVQSATPMTLIADVADGDVARVESDLPILVHRHSWYATSSTDHDAYVMVAAAREILGGNSGNTRLVAAEDNTDVTVWYSSGITETVTLNRTDVYTVSNAGNQGSGDAVRVVASAPVMAVSYGDGDGGETVTFLPTRELGRRFVLPRAAEYVLVATASPATTCQILDTAGTEVTSQLSNSYGADYPNRVYFTNVAAGNELRCDKPVWAMFEDSATNTERNLWPIKLHRPRVHPEPTATLGTLESQYVSTLGTVVTPTFVAPYAVQQWTAFLETADVPTGTWLHYQLSDDDGQHWYFYDGQQWADASNLEAANPWWDVHLHLDQFFVTSDQLTVKAILGSDNGAQTPTLDTVQILYTQVQQAEQFVFDAVPSPQMAGVPFRVTLRATDAEGHTIQDFTGPAYIQTLGQPTSPEITPAFTNGAVTFDVAVAEIGPAVQLYAYTGGVSGTSDPFEVLEPTGASIEYVSGDQQFALAGTFLPEPLVVQVLDDQGDPAGGVEVIFAITSGDGSLVVDGGDDGEEVTAVTDAAGRAQVRWQLGARTGAHRAEARLDGAEGSPVPFLARADYNPDLDHYELRGEGGGCSCRQGSRGAPDPSWLLFLIPLALWWRRRCP